MTVRMIFDGAIVVSLYLLFAGHNQPGGGFVGGLVAAGAIALRYVSGGVDEVRATERWRPWTYLAVGLGVSATTAALPVLAGRPVLDQGAVGASIPLLGKVKLTSATVFDIGVYLIVIGVILMIVEGLGGDPEEER